MWAGDGGEWGESRGTTDLFALILPTLDPLSVHSEPRCRSCERFLTCHECLQSHECGWCGNEDNPTLGR